MEVRNLITFLKIIETGSFSKAAEQLTYSQSTVTVQIQQLEEEIGVQLFDRIGKKIYVTEKGHELEAYAQQIIALTQQAAAIGGEAGAAGNTAPCLSRFPLYRCPPRYPAGISLRAPQGRYHRKNSR